MTANVSIEVAHKKDVLLIPDAALRVKITDEEAVVSRQKGQGVWILSGTKPRHVLIKTGISDGRFTEVISGDISAGDEIIVEVNYPAKKNSSPSTSRPPGIFR
jgi:HlyD family secretion protein